MDLAEEVQVAAVLAEDGNMASNLVKLVLGAIIAIVLLGLVIIVAAVGTYNGLVTADQEVVAQWGIVESKYQRRADLIPSLVETVKGITKQEQTVFIGVAEARSQWQNAKSPEDKLAAANGLDSAISRLLMIQESYPELKSNENFMALQAQLEGTENRISTERDRYTERVKEYNIMVKTAPSSIIAGMFNFKEKPVFKADEGAQNAPKVNFST